jgi:hypothetical protein
VTAVPDPWQVLATTDLVLVRVAMPELGRYYDEHRVIFIRKGLLLVEERAVLWHELVHSRRRDRRCADGVLGARQEASVDREAARWAIPLPALLEAMRGEPPLDEAADWLKTTPALLRVRLQGLHPAERAQVRRHLGEREWAA